MTLTEMPAKPTPKARKPRTPPKGRTSIVRAADAGEDDPTAVTPEPAPQHPAGELKLLKPDQIQESTTNPRKTFSGVEELAADLKVQGVLQPLLVRPGLRPWKGDAPDYELVCGARRLRAAKLAGLATVPCVVRPMTDKEALLAQVKENDQREDVPPLEQAEAYERLVEDQKLTAADIAVETGRPVSYVRQRLELLKLSKDWRKALERGRVPLAAALKVAPLAPADQKLVFGGLLYGGDHEKPTTTGEVVRYIRRHMTRNLSGAPWKKDDAELVPAAGACNACAKRTGADAALFDGLAEGPKEDLCLDGKCFAAKQQAFVQVKVKSLEEAGERTVLMSDNWETYRKPGHVSKWDVMEVSAKRIKQLSEAEKKRLRTAVVVDGNDAGRTAHILLPNRSAGARGGGGGVDDRYRREQKKREEAAKLATRVNAAIRDDMADLVADVQFPLAKALRILALAAWDYAGSDVRQAARDALGLTPPDGNKKKTGGGYADWLKEAFETYVHDTAAVEGEEARLWRVLLLLHLQTVVKVSHWSTEKLPKRLRELAEMAGVDVEEIRDRITAEERESRKAAQKGARKKTVKKAAKKTAPKKTAPKKQAPAAEPDPAQIVKKIDAGLAKKARKRSSRAKGGASA